MIPVGRSYGKHQSARHLRSDAGGGWSSKVWRALMVGAPTPTLDRRPGSTQGLLRRRLHQAAKTEALSLRTTWPSMIVLPSVLLTRSHLMRILIMMKRLMAMRTG
jgi:hypothetical protein